MDERSTMYYNEPRSRYSRQTARPERKPEPEFADLRLRHKTIKRLKYFSTMDNESYDDILNLLMDVCDGVRRRTVFEDKAWMRSGPEYQMLLSKPARSKLQA
jgi:hypothetical protein